MSHALFQRDYEERISGWLKQVKFRKRVFGGVDEADVWKKIAELNDMYKEALLVEQAKYQSLLERKGLGEGEDPDL